MAGLTGTVTTSAYNDSYGNYVVIKDSKGYELRYAHLSSRSVSAGASVTKGDEIGLVGNTGNSTGSHLHIELLKNGERLNPIFYLETGEKYIPYCIEPSLGADRVALAFLCDSFEKEEVSEGDVRTVLKLQFRLKMKRPLGNM